MPHSNHNAAIMMVMSPIIMPPSCSPASAMGGPGRSQCDDPYDHDDDGGGGSMTDSGFNNNFNSNPQVHRQGIVVASPHSPLRSATIDSDLAHHHTTQAGRSSDPVTASLAVPVDHRGGDPESEPAWRPIVSAAQPEASESSPSRKLPWAASGGERTGQSEGIQAATGTQHGVPQAPPPPHPPSPQASGNGCSAGVGAQADVDYELLTQVIESLEGEIHELKFLVDQFKQVRVASSEGGIQ